jgi:pyruvate dehydrogenase E2 component (dihydrolipoamide acetyltransferase)
MSAAAAARSGLKAIAAEGEAVPSFNDMVVKACALALREHPRANGSYRDGRLGLRQIAIDVRTLAAKVREGSITPPELSGGTFTVSKPRALTVSAPAPVASGPR